MSDNELLRCYLLGELPEDEERSVEERLLRDDELAEIAEAIESEILEDYARGELSPAQRRRVDGFLSSSPSGRIRLAVVQGLGTIAAETRADNVLPFRRPDLSRPTHRFAAIAAVLAIAVASVTLVQVRHDLPEQMAAAPPGMPRPPIREDQRVVPPPPQETPGPVVIAETPIPVPPPTPSPAFALIQLALSVTRDEGQEIPSVRVAENQAVRLRIQLRERDKDLSSYQVVLEDGIGQEADRWEGLQQTVVDGEQVLLIDIPEGLQEGRYTARVQGVTDEGTVKNLAFPEFEVRRS